MRDMIWKVRGEAFPELKGQLSAQDVSAGAPDRRERPGDNLSHAKKIEKLNRFKFAVR